MGNQIDLNGRVAVVTGGAQGIGQTIAERLLASGAAVAVWDRNLQLASRCCKGLSVRGRIIPVKCDIRSLSAAEQARAERIYIRLFGFYLLLRGKRLSKHIAGYKHKRGMDFLHDVRDWIGGYPYESIAPRELAQLLRPLGFDLIRQNVRKRSGLFGSGNDEYLFRRHDADSNSRHP